MGILSRLANVTKANLNELLDHMEDPAVMLRQYVREMEEELAKAEAAVTRQLVHEKVMAGQLEEAAKVSEHREATAAEALKQGEEAAARMALEEKLAADRNIRDLQAACLQSEALRKDLELRIAEMKAEFERMRAKQKELAERSETAKAKKSMLQASYGYGIDAEGASRGFRRMEEKILHMEAELEVRKNGLGYPIPGAGTGAAMGTELDLAMERLKEKVSSIAPEKTEK